MIDFNVIDTASLSDSDKQFVDELREHEASAPADTADNFGAQAFITPIGEPISIIALRNPHACAYPWWNLKLRYEHRDCPRWIIVQTDLSTGYEAHSPFSSKREAKKELALLCSQLAKAPSVFTELYEQSAKEYAKDLEPVLDELLARMADTVASDADNERIEEAAIAHSEHGVEHEFDSTDPEDIQRFEPVAIPLDGSPLHSLHGSSGPASPVDGLIEDRDKLSKSFGLDVEIDESIEPGKMELRNADGTVAATMDLPGVTTGDDTTA